MVFISMAVVASLSYAIWAMFRSDEVVEKSVWAVLQGVEAQHRNLADRTTPMTLENANGSGFTVVGLPTGDARFPRAWLIVNKTTPGARVKILPPDIAVQVSCSYVDEIHERMQVEQAASEFLSLNCRD